MKLRIVAADDNPNFLKELVSLLNDDFDVVETAADGKSALECICRHRPDIAILDLAMPHLNGIEVTRQLTMQHHRPVVLICSVETDPDLLDAAREAGALGYVFKGRIAEDLIPAIKSVASGQHFWSPVAST